MGKYLHLKKSNCKNCYKCIRKCPVKSIGFSDNQAKIIENECILCGQCFVNCPQNAKEIRNDIERAKQLIRDNEKVVVSLAPSFVANYKNSNFQQMKDAILKLGFYDVGETALGAAVVKNRYDEMINEQENSVIISSCCHSVNILIQKYYPDLLKYLAPVLSPMQAHCKIIKEEIPDAKTVFIGPCISKKEEADKYPEYVDCVLTFEELSQWLDESNIQIENSVDESFKGKTRLFPTAGGILRSMNCESKKYAYIAVDGAENCINALKDIQEGNIKDVFIEMSACTGSCINGPAMEKNQPSPIFSFKAVNDFAGENDFIYKKYSPKQLNKIFDYTALKNTMPGSTAIKEVLKKMGKTMPEHELNCGCCGYESCREKAIAVLMGKADLSMCLPFLKEKAESFSDNIINNTPNGIIVLNESLEIQQINKAALKIINMKNANDVLGEQLVSILDPTIYFEVMHTGKPVYDRKEYLSEYNKYVEQTIVYDQSYHIIMAILKDITEIEEEQSKKEKISRQTIDITESVIQKQMRAVQEIALLLGETTAETKVALTKLKEFLENE